MVLSRPTKLKKLTEVGSRDILFCVARVPNSAELFYGSSDSNVYTIDMDAEKPQPVSLTGDGHSSYVTGVTLAGRFVVSGGYDGRLIWWDAKKRHMVRSVDGHQKWIRRVVSSPDGSIIVSVADDMLCKLWDAQDGKLLRTFADHKRVTPHHYPSMLYALAVSPDGQFLATGDRVGHVVIRDLAGGEKLAEIETPVMYTWDPRQRRHSIGGVRSLAFSHDSKLLAVGGMGQVGNIDHLRGPSRVELFDWKAGDRLLELEDKKLKGLVEQVAFHESGRWFLAAGGDHNGFVTFYDTNTGKITTQQKAPMHVHGFAFNETFDMLYAVGHGKIVVWELEGENPRSETDPPAKAKNPAADK